MMRRREFIPRDPKEVSREIPRENLADTEAKERDRVPRELKLVRETVARLERRENLTPAEMDAAIDSAVSCLFFAGSNEAEQWIIRLGVVRADVVAKKEFEYLKALLTSALALAEKFLKASAMRRGLDKKETPVQRVSFEDTAPRGSA